MKWVCSVCGKTYRDNGEDDGKVSHGWCSDHIEDLKKEVEELKEGEVQ
jgi:hypothetical protein